jgi:hypothetical protein
MKPHEIDFEITVVAANNRTIHQINLIGSWHNTDINLDMQWNMYDNLVSSFSGSAAFNTGQNLKWFAMPFGWIILLQ